MQNIHSNSLTTISSFPNVIISRTPSTLSRTSSYRSQSSSSSTGVGNKKFAPPPQFPKSLEVAKMQICNRKMKVLSTLPPYHDVRHSGELLARFSLKSMLTMKWRSTFWIAYGKNQILFFRSKHDFEEWAANPYISTIQRNLLVKTTIDFKNDVYKPGFNLKGYKVSSIKSKYIRDGKSKRMASNFKLERYNARGASIVIALGGKNAGEVGALHAVMYEMAKKCGHKLSSEIVDADMGMASDAEESVFGSDYGSIGFSFSNVSTGSTQSMHLKSAFDQRDDESSRSMSRGRQMNNEGLGTRILTRMRSRSPSTRARRLREIDDELMSDSTKIVKRDRPYTNVQQMLPVSPRYKTPIRDRPPLPRSCQDSSTANWAKFE